MSNIHVARNGVRDSQKRIKAFAQTLLELSERAYSDRVDTLWSTHPMEAGEVIRRTCEGIMDQLQQVRFYEELVGLEQKEQQSVADMAKATRR